MSVDESKLPNSRAEKVMEALRKIAPEAYMTRAEVSWWDNPADENDDAGADTVEFDGRFKVADLEAALLAAEQPNHAPTAISEQDRRDIIEALTVYCNLSETIAREGWDNRFFRLRTRLEVAGPIEQANGRVELDDDAVRRGVQAGCEVGAFLLCGRPEEDAVRAIVKAALNGG